VAARAGLARRNQRRGVTLGEVPYCRLAQKTGMNGGHAIRAVRADDRQVRHPDVLRLPFLDQARARLPPEVSGKPRANVVHQAAIDLENDLEWTGNEKLHPFDGPPLQRLGKQGVVGVSQRSLRDIPRLVPAQMGVVE
jgi:hypothetical protein